LFGRLWTRLKVLWTLARSERAAPHEIGWAVGIGAFAGCTPAIGFHGALALGLATAFKKNRLFAWLGSRISNMLVLPFITLAEIQIAHRVRVGAWVVLDREHALQQAGALFLDWCLGTLPVGAAIGLALGVVAWIVARRRDRAKAPAEDGGRETPPVSAPPGESHATMRATPEH
jgi:uncharacterized protein (DUF2062 family)